MKFVFVDDKKKYQLALQCNLKNLHKHGNNDVEILKIQQLDENNINLNLHSNDKLFQNLTQVYQYMKQMNVTNVVYLACNSMVYMDFQKMENKFKSNKIYSTPIGICESEPYLAMMIIPNAELLKQVLINWNKKPELQNTISKCCDLIEILPMFDFTILENQNKPRLTKINQFNANYSHLKYIFDPIFIGEYLCTESLNTNSLFPYDQCKFIWRYEQASSLWCPYIDINNYLIKIVNLCVTKELCESFASFGSELPKELTLIRQEKLTNSTTSLSSLVSTLSTSNSKSPSLKNPINQLLQKIELPNLTLFEKEAISNKLFTQLYITEEVQDKAKIINCFHKHFPELGQEHFHKLLIQYMNNPQAETTEQLLHELVINTSITVEMKYHIVHTINNHREKQTNQCKLNKLIIHICNQPDIGLFHTMLRVEMMMILFESLEYEQESIHILKQFLEDETILQWKRYNYLVRIAENANVQVTYKINGFLMVMNSILYTIDYRILATQFLLQNENVELDTKWNCQQFLIQIAEDNYSVETTNRANAADTILTLGTEEFKNRAHTVICTIGLDEFSAQSKINQTVFANSQNVHNSGISESVKQVVLYLSSIPIKVQKDQHLQFNDVVVEILKLLDHNITDIESNDGLCEETKDETKDEITDIPDDDNDEGDDYALSNQSNGIKIKNVKSSLLRILMDQTLYIGSETLKTILVKIWQLIQEHQHRSTLEQRLLEELNEMSGTCSSGFISRLVNVLSGFEIDGKTMNLSIDFESQIHANLLARLQARLSKWTHDEFLEHILNELTWTSNLEQRTHWNFFVKHNLLDIRSELLDEFVHTQNLMSEEVFDINFRKVITKNNFL